MPVWLTRPGLEGQHESKFLSEGRIYLTWDRVNRDLSTCESKGDIYNLLRELLPEQPSPRLTQNVGQLRAFAHLMQPGDWVCTPSKTRRTIHIGKITGDYQFDATMPDPYYHWRTVNWLGTDIPRDNFDEELLTSLRAQATICQFRCDQPEQRLSAFQENHWQRTPPLGSRTTFEPNKQHHQG